MRQTEATMGPVDADPQEIALNALDARNTSGKMIGVIGHVVGMKERIPAQIGVDKSGGVGYSQLSILLEERLLRSTRKIGYFSRRP